MFSRTDSPSTGSGNADTNLGVVCSSVSSAVSWRVFLLASLVRAIAPFSAIAVSLEGTTPMGSWIVGVAILEESVLGCCLSAGRQSSSRISQT